MKGWITYNTGIVFLVCFLFGFPVIFWIWDIGTKLNKMLPSEVKLNLTIFKIATLYPPYFVIFLIIYLIFGGDMIYLIPFHFAILVTYIYSNVFAAKTIKSIELGRGAKVSDYMGDVFLLMIYPIGILLIQPRIHKIIGLNE